ncbi:MAG: hypothetical protein H6726_21130 [Sandaracinaceae bacterium]|nr:hypothetical protein [Sandaracinaceae bacterium]
MSHRRVAVASVCILAMTLAGTSGCTPMTTVTAVGYPTPSAAPRVTNSPFAIGNGRVFVVTPAYLQVVAPTLADQADKIDEGYAEAVDSGRAVIPEYATVASAFERHLLDAGLQPIAEDTLTSALSDEAVSARFDALAREQGAVTLLQLAMEVGPRIDASLALLVRSSRLGYTDRPIVYFPGPARCEPLRIQPLEALLDVALVATDTGDILWSGEMTLRASDLLPEPVTFPRGPHRAQFTHQYSPTFIIYGQDDGTRCGTTSIGGFFCMEWGANSGGCLTVAPAFPEVNAYMVDETVRRLVEIMTPLAHVAEQ